MQVNHDAPDDQEKLSAPIVENFRRLLSWLIVCVFKETIRNPYPSMYGVFAYIYHEKSTIHVGKYSSPIDGMG